MKKPIKLLSAKDLKPRKVNVDLLKDVPVSGDLEKDCKVELSETLKAFKKRAKDENYRMQNATDSEHWIAVSFQTRDQKEAFLKSMDWLKFGDKYLDGEELAKQQAIELPASPLKMPREAAKDKLRSMAAIREI